MRGVLQNVLLLKKNSYSFFNQKRILTALTRGGELAMVFTIQLGELKSHEKLVSFSTEQMSASNS